MSTITYTNPDLVTEHKETEQPWSGRTATGYGRKIPTTHMIRYEGRWHRIYVMNYGNAGSAYIVHKGQDLFIDTETKYAYL